jgi:hypothetical protein
MVLLQRRDPLQWEALRSKFPVFEKLFSMQPRPLNHKSFRVGRKAA